MTDRTEQNPAPAPDAALAPDADLRLRRFRPVQLRRAADEVVAVLVDAVRGGLYAVGEQLPRERDLAAQLGVSRTVLRQAIYALEQAGVVSVRRGNQGGITVESVANVPSVLTQLHSHTQTTVRTLLEMRRPVELQAALLAGERGLPADWVRLEQLAGALEQRAGDSDEFLAADVQFHFTIAQMAANEPLLTCVRTFFDAWLAIRVAQFPVGHVDFDEAIRNQYDTLEALKSRDRDWIVRSMDVHLGALEEIYLGHRLTFP
jgi:DNA-binding FadR family transcriptional regulator